MKLVYNLLILTFFTLSTNLVAQNLSDMDLIRIEINSYRYNQALTMIEQSLSSLSNDPAQRENLIDLTILKAQVLKKMYKIDEAIEVIVSIIEPDKIDQKLFLELADCHKAAGDYQNALNTYSFINTVSPSTFINTEIAVLNYRLENWDEVIKSAKMVIERDTINTMLRLLGDSFNKYENLAGHKDSALIYYNLLLERKPNDGATLSKICRIHLLKDNIDKVLKLTEDFIKKDSSQHNIFEIYGLALHMKKKYAESYQVFKFLIDNEALSFGSYYYAGYNLYLMKRYYDAIPYFKEAKTIDPYNINNIYNLALSQSHSGLVSESFQNLDEGLEILLSQDSITIYKFYNTYSLGMIARSKYDEAINYLLKAQKYYPEDPSTLFNLASVYERKKDYKKAKEKYQAYISAMDKAYEGKSSNYTNQQNYTTARDKIREMDIQIFYQEEEK